FLIDDQGILRHEWRGVKVKGHVEDVLDTLKSLKKAAV
ncbi:MAG TPA: peroxiredoxin, partial [Chromatiaceae bacterium]|nr:peroxiredoxin [Chromatiaceae bacterium]